MIYLLIHLLVVLLVLGLVAYIISILPVDEVFKRVGYIVLLIILLLVVIAWVLPGTALYRF
jgi:hypothetical protein